MRLRLYESAITSRSVFLRKICGPATFEFCNKIGPSLRIRRLGLTSAFGGEPEVRDRDADTGDLDRRRANDRQSLRSRVRGPKPASPGADHIALLFAEFGWQ